MLCRCFLVLGCYLGDIYEAYDGSLVSVALEDDDLVFALVKKRGGEIEGLLRSCGVEVSADIEAVYSDKALGKAVKTDVGVAWLVCEIEISAKEHGRALLINGREREGGEIVHSHRIYIPSEVVSSSEHCAAYDTLFVKKLFAVVYSTHIFDENIYRSALSEAEIEGNIVVASVALDKSAVLAVYEYMSSVVYLAKAEGKRLDRTVDRRAIEYISEVLTDLLHSLGSGGSYGCCKMLEVIE